MSSARAENVIKTIIVEIVEQCSLKGHSVSEALVAFMVKAVVLDPGNGFNVDRALTKQDVHKLTELCLDKLLEKCSPSLDTIKMQLYFDMNYTSRSEFLQEIRQMLESKLSPLTRDITDTRVRRRDQLDALYQQVVRYILLHSGMGSTSDANAVHQTTAALQSVFPQTEMGTFMVLLKKDKEQQLGELASIVTGIRLFNRVSRKQGKDMDLRELMPDVLHEVLPSTSERIQAELQLSEGLAFKYSLLLDQLTHPDRQGLGRHVPLVLLKQALYNVRQHQVFLKRLLVDVSQCTQNVELLQTELSSQMNMLKQTVQSKSAVPTARVYPLFRSVSQVWSGLQDEAELLHILNNICLNLQPFTTSQAKMFSEAYLDQLLEKVQSEELNMDQLLEKVQTEEENMDQLLEKVQIEEQNVDQLLEKVQTEEQNIDQLLEKVQTEEQNVDQLLEKVQTEEQNIDQLLEKVQTKEQNVDQLLEKVQTEEQNVDQRSGEWIDPSDMKTQEWLFPENLSNLDQVLLQFNGFCGYTLVQRDGLLLPGDPGIGIFKHQERLYVFSSREAALQFSCAPDAFISAVAEKAKRSPELIQLLRLHQHFPSVSPYTQLQMKAGDSLVVKSICKCESGTQTDVHPLEPNIHRTYQWNEWELRRRAIKLADLRTRTTVSTQTPLSHMRRDNATQIWTPKNAESQTQREGGTGVPRPLVYLRGLRGQRDAHLVPTHLTAPVDK